MEKQTNPKVVSILSYLTIIGWIAGYALNQPKSELGSFHQRQGLGILLMFVIAGMLSWFPILGWMSSLGLSLTAIVFWFIGFIAALNEKETLVPILGEKFQEWFESL